MEDTKRAIGKNYIAIVTYTAEAQVVIDFTSDIDALQNALDSINPIIEEKDEYEDGDRNICAGLECAYTLLNNIHGGNITKNLLLCTTGVTDNGEYSYDGWYNENTIGSTWQNEITEIRLYAYANPAIACANMIKANGVTIYVLGIFDPIEGNMPSNSSVGDIAKFFRLTARDIASSDNTFYPVEDVETLDFYFGELQDDLTGSALLKLYNNSTAYKDNSFTDWEGGALGKGGHFEEILWGPSLFEVPATQIFRSDISAPDSINRNLAMLGGSLSAAAYDADYMIQAYMDLGFQKDDVFLYSYPGSQNNRSEARRNGKKFADDNDLGFAIASRSMQINGSDCDLLIITLRGTHNIWEAVKDGTMNLDKNFYSYYAWDWVYEFEEDVFAGIDDYRAVHTELGSRPMKVLITGHSLAGAAANLVAARFNMFCDRNDWFSDALSIDDIYAYTYGAIDAISDRKSGELFYYKKIPVTDGYANIINIYNLLDNFGPRGDVKGLKILKDQKIYGKFGEFYLFENTMDDYISASDWPQHEIAGYLQAIRNGFLQQKEDNSRVRVLICCPVDAEVLLNGNTICLIKNNQIVSISPSVTACVNGDVKTVLLPAGSAYRLLLTATDTGTMDLVVQNTAEDAADHIAFTDVALVSGKQMESDLRPASSTDAVELFTLGAGGKKIAQIQLDGTEKSLTVINRTIRALRKAYERVMQFFTDNMGLSKTTIILVAGFLLIFLIDVVLAVHIIKKRKSRRRKKLLEKDEEWEEAVNDADEEWEEVEKDSSEEWEETEEVYYDEWEEISTHGKQSSLDKTHKAFANTLNTQHTQRQAENNTSLCRESNTRLRIDSEHCCICGKSLNDDATRLNGIQAASDAWIDRQCLNKLLTMAQTSDSSQFEDAVQYMQSRISAVDPEVGKALLRYIRKSEDRFYGYYLK